MPDRSLVTRPSPPPPVLMDNVKTGASPAVNGTNVATTVRWSWRANRHSGALPQVMPGPSHPANIIPGLGSATSAMELPTLPVSLHRLPQLMLTNSEARTTPWPAPARFTCRAAWGPPESASCGLVPRCTSSRLLKPSPSASIVSLTVFQEASVVVLVWTFTLPDAVASVRPFAAR